METNTKRRAEALLNELAEIVDGLDLSYQRAAARKAFDGIEMVAEALQLEGVV